MSAVIAVDLTKTFTTGRGRRHRSVEAVRALSLRVLEGERLAVIGPNGAGKSTTIKMLTGLMRPDSGTAEVLGLVPWRDRIALSRRIGTLFGQRSVLWFELTPRETFELLGSIHGLPSADVSRRTGLLGDLLEAADLFDVPVRAQSLGQRMRCELAACLLHSPEILFLDEPSIGLDLAAKHRFRELLVRLNTQAQTTVVLTSHDVADIESVAQRVVIIDRGQIIRDGDIASLRRTLLARKTVDATLARAGTTDDLAALPGVTVVATEGERLLRLHVDVSLTPVKVVLDRLLALHDVTDISVADPPLEEVLTAIYEGTADERDG